MLFVIFAFSAVAVVVGSVKLRMPERLSPAKLGWMSEQWLADYRASHGS